MTTSQSTIVRMPSAGRPGAAVHHNLSVPVLYEAAIRRAEGVIASGGPLVVIYTTDLETMEAKIKAAGGSVVGDIHKFPGGQRLHFTDPSGNELAVWTETSD